jgi:endonuclease I
MEISKLNIEHFLVDFLGFSQNLFDKDTPQKIGFCKSKLKELKMKKYIVIILLFVTSYLLAQIPNGYYDSAQGLTGENLKSALHNIIKNHTEFSYNTVWDILQETDEDPYNHNNVRLLYTGWSYPKSNHGGSASQWNREHVWAKSHGNFGTAIGPGTDVHHLRPTDVTVNSRRGSLDFDNGGSEYIDGDGATGCYVDNNSWEPRDAVKGDVARMIFYMAVRYEGGNGEPDLELVDYVNSSPNGQPYMGKLSTLLEWNEQDPPDDFERNRNDIIYYQWQHNRNPFIDHYEYADYIWGDQAEEEDVIDITQPTLTVYPNPFNPQTTVSFMLNSNKNQEATVVIYNLKGEKVKTLSKGYFKSDKNYSVTWNGKNNDNKTVSSGNYIIILKTDNIKISKSITLLK